MARIVTRLVVPITTEADFEGVRTSELVLDCPREWDDLAVTTILTIMTNERIRANRAARVQSGNTGLGIG